MPNIFNQVCGRRVLDISIKSSSLKISTTVDKFEKYSKTRKLLDFGKLLHWICKIFKVLFVNQSAWYHHEKVNHFCKFYQLEISELCFFCTFRLYLAISQYCQEHSLKTLDDAWKNSITGNSAVLQFFFIIPSLRLVHLAVAVNSFHKSLCIAARGKKHKSI